MALRAALEARDLPRKEVAVGCAAMDLPESFEGYAAGLKKRMRSKARAALRQSGAPGWVFAWCDEPAGLEGQALRWVPPAQLGDQDILPADLPVIEALQQMAS